MCRKVAKRTNTVLTFTFKSSSRATSAGHDSISDLEHTVSLPESTESQINIDFIQNLPVVIRAVRCEK